MGQRISLHSFVMPNLAISWLIRASEPSAIFPIGLGESTRPASRKESHGTDSSYVAMLKSETSQPYLSL